ncbi:MAG: DUF4826 family protein [Planctomycetes bacterium]|nr:DUF4826 family protein [Planctomycetota bacterium]
MSKEHTHLPNYENPAADESWCADRRVDVARYLAAEGVEHGRIGERPAWHVAPYVSVWAIESKLRPGWIGWWVICGDLPTDYVSAGDIRHPRAALQAIADRWLRYSQSVRAGAAPAEFSIASVERAPLELVPLLEARAEMLADWAQDDSLWAGE